MRAYVIAANEMGADYHNQKGSHWIIDLPIANPMSVYEEYKAERTSWGINALGTVVVQVELTDGTIGIGCSIGGEPACYIIEKHLSRFVEGQDPRNVELIWDQMWRATMPYGRKGSDGPGDQRGRSRYLGLPRQTTRRACVRAASVARRKSVCRCMQRPRVRTSRNSWGFHGAKIPCRYGPADGPEGLKRTLPVMAGGACCRLVLIFRLRLDCYMALTVPYAIQPAKALAPYDLYYGLKSVLPPDDYDGYAALKLSA